MEKVLDTDNDEGLILGGRIAMYGWAQYRAYVERRAPPRVK